MKEPQSNSSNSRRRSAGVEGNEFTDAMARLEKAVQEVVSVTTGQLSERATSLLNDTSARLEEELRLRRVADDPEEVELRQARRRRRLRQRHRIADRAEKVNPQSGRLYRDPENQKIGGVCAGVARYFGIETWMVRLGALTGLFILPGIVFPAYWIAYFIMDTPDNLDSEPKRKGRDRERSRERRQASLADNDASSNRRAGAYNATRELRHTNVDLTQAELRLRRLESFVTSDQYELQKELTKIEREAEQSHAG